MSSFWDIPTNHDGAHNIDPGLCRRVVMRSGSVAGIRRYLDQILSSLEGGDSSVVGEAQGVAVPLAYRLAIDDTARNYRIASRLKEAMMRVAYPEIMKCVEDEIEWLCGSACGVTYNGLKRARKVICDELLRLSRRFDGKWQVYGRRKSASSVFAKLAKLKSGAKRPKTDNLAVSERLSSFLRQFENQVRWRASQEHAHFQGYSLGDVKLFLPDLLGFTLQLKEENNAKRNLGSTKAKYRGIYRKLSTEFPGNVFYGPAYSKAWHMNRMVCHMEYQLDLASQVAFEVFVRTDFDYFIGYGSYWRYKGVDLFAAASQEDVSARREFVSNIRRCRKFAEVQKMLFKQVVSGQLSLF